MGYDLHITRQNEWYEDDPERKIALPEWMEIVANDPQLQLDREASGVAMDGSLLQGEALGSAVWTDPELEEKAAWFHFADGNIDVKNPDKQTIAQMLRIADKLGAKVIGDDGELYETAGVSVYGQSPVDVRASSKNVPSADNKEKPWWKFW